MLTLLLFRHAKSSRPAGVGDFDRPLAARGRRAIEEMAARMRAAGYLPDLILCSPARRTRETCELLAPALGCEAPVRLEPDLYLAEAGRLLRRIRAAPDEIRALLAIGHNPGVQELATLLAGAGDRDGLAMLRTKFPTAALAALRFEGKGWSSVAKARGRLEAFMRPGDGDQP